MAQFTKYKQVLLPTDTDSKVYKRTDLGISKFGKQAGYIKYLEDKPNEGYYKSQHLYILSDEEIKEGDWLFNTDFPDVFQHKEEYWETDLIDTNAIKKIVASTNPELNLPSPTDEYLQEYCKNPQDEVEIESMTGTFYSGIFGSETTTKLILNSNNTINCRLPVVENHNFSWDKGCGLSKYEWELDNLADQIKRTESSLECIGILRAFIDNKIQEL